MMLCYSKTRGGKLDPPPSKKAQGYERSRYIYTHIDKDLSIPAARDLDIH